MAVLPEAQLAGPAAVQQSDPIPTLVTTPDGEHWIHVKHDGGRLTR